ncbi:condensation domain-containing protein, partial [bacterium]|nr:condensation domain-containing protein [bacterium]
MDSFHSRNDVPLYKKRNLNKSTLDLTIFQKTEGLDIPLSFAQERLWFLEQLDPKNPVHNISTGLKFRGRLNVSVLERSVNKIVACHEILRTIFRTKNDNLVQQVLPELTVPILKINLKQLGAAEQHKKIKELIAEDIQNGFYLFTPPLIRFTLLVTGPEEYILLITTHQIICDEISLDLLIRELSKVYSSFIKNADAEIPYPVIQFTEYSCWQRQWIKSEFAQQQVDYWIKHLNQTPSILSLPTDRPRPAIQSFYGSFIECVLDNAASTKLKSLCTEEDATLLMGLLTAFDILLHRYTGEEDILIGSTVTGRTWEQTQSLIGLLANTVVIRTNFSGNPTFRELLRRVREECIKAFSNQDVPIEKLIDELHPERTLSHSPLFQIMFSTRKQDHQDCEFPDLQVERIEIENAGAKLDLTLEVKEEREQIKLVWRYSSDLFEPQTIENLSQ